MALQIRRGSFREWARATFLALALLTGPLLAADTPEALAAEKSAVNLMKAAQQGDLNSLEHLLAEGTDVNLRAASGLTAWQVARMRGQKETADFLLAKGADAQLPWPPLETLVDMLFARRMGEPGAPGSAVLIARDGKILLARGYGMADLDGKTPITPKTKFRIGSVTKQFTAAAILKLQEQGKLSVADRLSNYYPDFPRGNEVTLRHLLTHTSGLHSYTAQPDLRAE